MRSTKVGIIRAVLSSLFVTILFALSNPSRAEVLAGAPGVAPQWGSGWINLAPPVDFTKGDRLRILIGGEANKVLVRLLPKGQPPDSSVGIVREPIDVPKTRIVELVLPQDHKQVVQISVHGGSNPWGKFPLGGGNGAATIESAERIKP